MSDEFSVAKVDMGDEFRVCPDCGYEDGFQSMFQRSAENGHLNWLLVCPNCSNTYDIGLIYKKPPA